MSKVQIILIIIAVLALLGIVVFPVVNRRQFWRMSFDQQVLLIMKEANGLIFFKNVSRGTKGTLYYVKNKRKILVLPWVLTDNKMLVIKDGIDKWDYPEEQDELTDDERNQFFEELEKHNKKLPVKFVIK